MALLAIQYELRDYEAWRATHDAMSESNQQWGVMEEAVHRLADEPNTVLTLRYFATVAQAQGYLTNRELQASIQQSEVEGTLRVEIYR